MKAYWDSLTKEQQGELAGKVGSTPGYLRLVFNGYKKASFVLAKKLEQCTSGAITKSDLRPDISGSVNANSGTLNNVTINENCQIKGKLSANQIEGDIVKTVSKSFPRTSTYASGTITVRISDDQKFDRQVMIPPVLFRGGKHENFNSNNQQSYWYSTCRLRVTRNGQEIFNQSTTDAQGVFSSVIDMPAGQGTLTLTFTVSSSGANNWTPTTSISDLLVVVMKKSTAGISIS